MENAMTVIGAIIVLGAVYVLLPVMADAYRRFRHPRSVVCPETGVPTTVRVNAAHAAGSAIAGPPAVQIQGCARWPERATCGRECAATIDPLGIAPAPNDLAAAGTGRSL
jgi:hypothetical protein